MLGECVGERRSVPVGQLAKLVLIVHRACGGARAEQAPSEARALLVGPVDEAQRDGWRAALGDPTQHLRSGDDVEGAVEPAAVRNRVDVTPEEHRALRLAGEREPLIPGCVDRLLRARVRDEAPEPLPSTFPRLRPGDSLGSAFVPRECAELFQLDDGPLRIEGHDATLTACFECGMLCGCARKRSLEGGRGRS